ncbi:MAG: class I SAM-dependent methyltransferase [Ignavibacterium sp.]|nr:MAG: class I SAM-dependent methyltransferase [Ignavibacterium sp.]
MKKYDDILVKCKICGSQKIQLCLSDLNDNEIYKCNDCKIQFMNPQYTDEYLSDYYSHYTKEEPQWDEPLSYGHNYYMSLVEKYGAQKGNLLDIGSGKGHLIKEAKKRGWKPYGYDVDCSSVEYFSKKLNIKIFCGDFEKIDWKDKTFNMVSMHHVFEHLKDPISYLQIIDKILVKDGLLFIALPNIKSLSSRMKFILEKIGLRKSNIGKYYDTSHHLFYYEPKTLKDVIKKRGYKILQVRSGHKVRPNQSMLKRYFLRNFSERIAWKSTFIIIAQKM